jgi:hypothetical protein
VRLSVRRRPATENGSGRAWPLRYDPQKRWLPSAEAKDVGVGLEVRRFDDMLNTVGLQDATRLYRRR